MTHRNVYSGTEIFAWGLNTEYKTRPGTDETILGTFEEKLTTVQIDALVRNSSCKYRTLKVNYFECDT